MEQLFKITFDGASALEYEEDEGWVYRDSITHAICSPGGNSQSKQSNQTQDMHNELDDIMDAIDLIFTSGRDVQNARIFAVIL